MPKTTKVVNETDSSITLKESTHGILSTLCDDLRPGKPYTIKVDRNATFSEYWCTEWRNDNKHVVMTNSDCIECREFRIKLKQDGTYTWEAVKRRSGEVVMMDAGLQARGSSLAADLGSGVDEVVLTDAGLQAQGASSSSGLGSGVRGKSLNIFKGCFSPTVN